MMRARQIAGRFMRSFESRRLWALAMILGGACIVLAMIIPSLWISLVLALIINFQLGLAFSSANSLTLDQVPSFRGTIMSLFTAANSMGMMILLRYKYGSLGIILGLLGFLAALIVYFLAHERT
jgi:MFS family permease